MVEHWSVRPRSLSTFKKFIQFVKKYILSLVRGGYSTAVSALVCGTGDEGSTPSSHPIRSLFELLLGSMRAGWSDGHPKAQKLVSQGRACVLFGRPLNRPVLP